MRLGYSEISILTVRSRERLYNLHFGGQGDYTARIVKNAKNIPKRYIRQFTARGWAWVYDDTERAAKFAADRIEFYRADKFGCIINLITVRRERYVDLQNE